MKFPTLLNDFQVKKVDTERVSTVQIYLQKIMIASKQLVKQRKIYSHIWKMGTEGMPNPVPRTTTKAFPH